MLDDIVTVQFALEKVLVQELLSAAGLPIPEFLEFDAADLATATAFLDRGPVPCVVKPVGSSGGASVTSGIRSATDLTRARLRVSRMDSRLMIERQAHGDFYRFLFLDGKLLDVIRRLPPRVTGDGRSTVDELIAAENARRVARRHEVLLRPLRVDLDCILTLEGAGLRLSSILPPGQTIVVKTVVSQNTIGDNETIRDQIAPELVDEARLAAELVGLRLAGVDIMTPDLTEPMRASGGVILEVNGTPGLHYHYEVADRTHATRVGVPVLETLLQ